MSDFADSLHEVFAALGPIKIRRMFGGQGVFHDGLMCALVADGTLYLKTDATTLPHFEALGLAPFSFMRQGRAMETSYRQAPETVFEDREAAAVWVRRAFEAALRVANAKPAPRPAQTPRKRASVKRRPKPAG